MHPLYTYIKQRLTAAPYTESEASALARWILEETFGFSSLMLYAGKDMDFPEENRKRLDDILLRLEHSEPIQYIIGKACFGGRTFDVTPAVLIPRPETEELVDWIVADCTQTDLSVLDIGTGSGCIAISLACRMNGAKVTAWDISAAALDIARKNAAHHGVRIDFRRVDVMAPHSSLPKTDIIVSNPPYVRESERAEMDCNVLDYEPEQALFVPDNDPLRFYRRIALAGQDMLAPGGKLFFEINRAYGSEMQSLLAETGYQDIELRKDFAGNDRMIKAVRQ